MSLFLDARIPVAFVADEASAMPEDALLLEGDGPVGRRLEARFTADEVHAAGCACCTGRSNAARGLSALYLARARSSGAPFRRVSAVAITPAGKQAVLDALASDVLASQWFKPA